MHPPWNSCFSFHLFTSFFSRLHTATYIISTLSSLHFSISKLLLFPRLSSSFSLWLASRSCGLLCKISWNSRHIFLVEKDEV
ncbi:hypothetical protein BOTBODRAFT_571132 [Botryobasidium botryosum FD-172 SS1]|uniref:Uncharacterized protein n=1 Tax=Botryobasidium botryosum (strain FD-172 SS1) TaxID=930990 RepID=A0A067M9K2_BOTB1|nr:hypothetical protein BOTBODRAFT_571132 [Botryobasidium botryosum FD-172 SS1]